MVKQKRNKNGPRTKRTDLKYFFLNGDLHRKLAINRGKDLLSTWNYPKAKKVSYNYTDALKRYEKAFKTAEVSKMLSRSRIALELAIRDGMIERPQFTYGIDENRNFYQYMWTERQIMDALDYFSGVHRGRPRHDGEITASSDLPTPREVRAMIHEEGETLYIKVGDKFIPSWRAKEI